MHIHVYTLLIILIPVASYNEEFYVEGIYHEFELQAGFELNKLEQGVIFPGFLSLSVFLSSKFKNIDKKLIKNFTR